MKSVEEIIGERSEPLSRVFNDQLRDIWRASEASDTLSGLFNRESRYMYNYTRKMVPITGRVRSFLLF